MQHVTLEKNLSNIEQVVSALDSITALQEAHPVSDTIALAARLLEQASDSIRLELYSLDLVQHSGIPVSQT
jgi:hypothetical protein